MFLLATRHHGLKYHHYTHSHASRTHTSTNMHCWTNSGTYIHFKRFPHTHIALRNDLRASHDEFIHTRHQEFGRPQNALSHANTCWEKKTTCSHASKDVVTHGHAPIDLSMHPRSRFYNGLV